MDVGFYCSANNGPSGWRLVVRIMYLGWINCSVVGVGGLRCTLTTTVDARLPELPGNPQLARVRRRRRKVTTDNARIWIDLEATKQHLHHRHSRAARPRADASPVGPISPGAQVTLPKLEAAAENAVTRSVPLSDQHRSASEDAERHHHETKQSGWLPLQASPDHRSARGAQVWMQLAQPPGGRNWPPRWGRTNLTPPAQEPAIAPNGSSNISTRPGALATRIRVSCGEPGGGITLVTANNESRRCSAAPVSDSAMRTLMAEARATTSA